MISRRGFLQGAVALSRAPSPDSASDWLPCADMPVGRSETPAVAHNDRIYVAGGFGAGARADLYDPVTDRWEPIADLPVATNHPGITVWNDKVIVAGGYTSDATDAHAGIWAYDGERDAWEIIGELPAKMGAFGLVAVGADLFAIGGALGQLGGAPSSKNWCTSDGDFAWRECAPLSVAREHLACIVRNRLVFAIGGRAHGQPQDALGSLVERYDPSADRWDKLAALPEPRSGLSGANCPIGIVVGGGETESAVFDTVQVLDNSDRTWRKLPDLPLAVHGAGMACVDDTLYVLGGSVAAGQVMNVPLTYRLYVAR